MSTKTNPFPRVRVLLALASCAGLVACATGPDLASPAVSRTPPPQEPEKTINNFFAFKLPAPQKNTNIGVGEPEPGDCALGYGSSMRGWVVPVVYRTYSGELGGKQTIQLNEKQYWFWFHGNNIAGITRRSELCPGLGSVFGDSDPPAAVAAKAVQAAFEPPARPVVLPEPRAQGTTTPKSAKGKGRTVQRAKKAEPAPAATR